MDRSLPLSRSAFWKGLPWALVPLGLWAVQLWSIWASPFSLEVTLLQFPFVLVFVVLIFVIAESRERERRAADLDA